MKAGESNWHVDHIEAMKGLLAQGLSSSQVAAALNDKFDTRYSRNAVIGKKIRLGIRDTAANIRLKSIRSLEKARAAPRRPQPPRPPKPLVEKLRPRPVQFTCSEFTGLRDADVVPLNISLHDLTAETCRWPYGDAAPFAFCGNPVWACGPYCEPHTSLSQGRGTVGEQIALKLPRSITG